MTSFETIFLGTDVQNYYFDVCVRKRTCRGNDKKSRAQLTHKKVIYSIFSSQPFQIQQNRATCVAPVSHSRQASFTLNRQYCAYLIDAALMYTLIIFLPVIYSAFYICHFGGRPLVEL